MKNLPFGRPGRFYKGNLHGHSTNSDGVMSPRDAVNHYRDADYDFVALSDHFVDRYEFPVTDTRPYRSDDFTTLMAAELHVPETACGEHWHILAVGLPLDFPHPVNGENGPQIAARAAATGAFIGILHPSWYGLTPEDARTIAVAH
ncbi:MAG TPA: phosphotransferase, partial [Rhodospirillales bacterium]|nr:phosphotransferase [Rhodospirillales bacterium]